MIYKIRIQIDDKKTNNVYFFETSFNATRAQIDIIFNSLFNLFANLLKDFRNDWEWLHGKKENKNESQ